MATPHKCPVCNGSGKVYLPPPPITNTAVFDEFKTCNACNGSGVVWEQDSINTWPVRPIPTEPFLPTPPQFVPNEPVVPLTFPKDFKFPDEIVEASKEKLIELLENWLKELKKEI